MWERWEPILCVSVYVTWDGGDFIFAWPLGAARWGTGVLGAPLRAGPVRAAQEVSQNLLEDVDDLPWQDIIFCQDFSKSRGKALVSVQFGKSLLS